MADVDQVMVFLCVLAPCSGQMFQCFNECSPSIFRVTAFVWVYTEVIWRKHFVGYTYRIIGSSLARHSCEGWEVGKELS